MYEVKRYTPDMADLWNSFAGKSKQGTFLFYRSYMDYHSDRFLDNSLMIWKKQHLCALLPANKANNILYSHQGLTYGGLLTDQKATVIEVCEIFRTINNYLRHAGFKKVIYKAIPWIYHQLPAEEDLYALTNICDARLIARHISSTLMMDNRIKFIESRKSGIRKARKAGIQICESEDLPAFWTILDTNLEKKYKTHPVHTLEELQLLKSRFPDQIKLFMAFNKENKAIGGTLIYKTTQVVHTQYISASPEGKKDGALDLLFDYLLNTVFVNQKKYFDFGKSSDGDGHELNTSLIFQKEGFGGRGVCYDEYCWNL
jgi:hypothetical protein